MRSSAHPLEQLSEQLHRLVEAMKACNDAAGVAPVHRLRTTTRRIEAQLLLLEEMPAAPTLRHARRLRRELKRVRRAAGEVRDVDVLLERVAALRAPATTAAKTPWQNDRERLQRHLRAERRRNARGLKDLLQHRSKMERLARRLLAELEEAPRVRLAASSLARLAGLWFAQRMADARRCDDETTRLHEMRKAAKLARYMAENAPDRRSAAGRLAARMEALQEAGGRWHDAVTLEQVAAGRLGSTSPLTEAVRRRARRLLETYKKTLREKSEAKRLIDADGGASRGLACGTGAGAATYAHGATTGPVHRPAGPDVVSGEDHQPGDQQRQPRQNRQDASGDTRHEQPPAGGLAQPAAALVCLGFDRRLRNVHSALDAGCPPAAMAIARNLPVR